ncbi:MAG TPA: CBS domain-containing protein [Gaiellales bacterium]
MSAPIAVERSLVLVAAARVMRDEGVDALPVVAGGRLIGIVTDHDLVVRAVAEDIDMRAGCVGDICLSMLVYVHPEQPLDHALQVMATHQVRHLPVVDGELHIVGTITQGDIARSAGGRRNGSRPRLKDGPLLPIS